MRRAVLLGLVLVTPATAQTFEVLPPVPGGTSSEAMGISPDGAVVVGASVSAGVSTAVRWVGGEPQAIATGVAKKCSVGGTVVVGDQMLAAWPRAFRWTPTQGIVLLGAYQYNTVQDCSRDGNKITVDDNTIALGVMGFIWIPGGGCILYGGGEFIGGRADAVSYNGAVAYGYVNGPNGGWHRRVEAGCAYQDLTVPPGFLPRFVAASTTGAIVAGNSVVTGAAFRGSAASWVQPLAIGANALSVRDLSGHGDRIVGNGTTALIWDPANGLRSLRDVLISAGAPLGDWNPVTAEGISENGTTIVGSASGPLGLRAYRATIPHFCYPNCDGSTAAPLLNVADFTCFLQKFAAGDTMYANCNNDAFLNATDFTCFLGAYAAGCP
jgi:hypothetical protein